MPFRIRPSFGERSDEVLTNVCYADLVIGSHLSRILLSGAHSFLTSWGVPLGMSYRACSSNQQHAFLPYLSGRRNQRIATFPKPILRRLVFGFACLPPVNP